MKDKLIAAGVLLAVVLGGVGLLTGDVVVNVPEPVVQVVEKNVGGSSQDEYFEKFFRSGLTLGGEVIATSTSGTVVPLSVRDIEKASVIDVTLNVADATLSFPASSTVTILPKTGDRKILLVRNATTTAAMDITFTGGTGFLFKKATTSAVLLGDTDGANFAEITLVRKANNDIEVLYVPYSD